jgi:hypothetical protein
MRSRGRDSSDEDEESSGSNLGLFGTLFAVLIGAVLIIAEARSGQSPTDAGPILLYGFGAILIGAPSVKYYFQLKGIDIDIGRRIGIDRLRGSNAIGSIEVKDGTVNVHQNAKTETERPDRDQFDFSQDFGLWESGDDRAIPFKLGEGEGLVGYVSAEDDVSAHFMTQRNYLAFDDDDAFMTEWHTEKGTYLQINFNPRKPGVYFLLVTNVDDLEDFEFADDHEDDDKFQVQVRLSSRQRRTNS